MILHASLQTDIAAFYSEWLIKTLKRGYVDIPATKGFNRYDFNLNNLQKVFIWSKNPEKMMKYKVDLKQLDYEFEIITQFTLYDKCYEPNIKSKAKILNNIRKLSDIFGRKRVSICYGPIFTTYNNPLEWHLSQIDFLLKELKGYIDHIYISYEISDECLMYTNYNIKAIPENQKKLFNEQVEELARKYKISVRYKPEMNSLEKDEIDLGEHNACPASCVYCIGGSNKKLAKIKLQRHRPDSSLLIGELPFNAKINNVILETIERKIEKTEEETDLLDKSIFT